MAILSQSLWSGKTTAASSLLFGTASAQPDPPDPVDADELFALELDACCELALLAPPLAAVDAMSAVLFALALLPPTCWK
jgi:hypothetical protein